MLPLVYKISEYLWYVYVHRCKFCSTYWQKLCIIEYGFNLRNYPLERELQICTVCRMQGFDFGRWLINCEIRERFLPSKFPTIIIYGKLNFSKQWDNHLSFYLCKGVAGQVSITLPLLIEWGQLTSPPTGRKPCLGSISPRMAMLSSFTSK